MRNLDESLMFPLFPGSSFCSYVFFPGRKRRTQELGSRACVRVVPQRNEDGSTRVEELSLRGSCRALRLRREKDCKMQHDAGKPGNAPLCRKNDRATQFPKTETQQENAIVKTYRATPFLRIKGINLPPLCPHRSIPSPPLFPLFLSLISLLLSLFHCGRALQTQEKRSRVAKIVQSSHALIKRSSL